jgi:hypothetical protein
MEMFISEEEILAQGLDSFKLILCTLEESDPSEYIFSSSLFKIPRSTRDFLTALRSFDLTENLTVVCYDNSNYSEAALVYLGLISVGLNARILIRKSSVVQHLVFLSGIPEEVKQNVCCLRSINDESIKTTQSLKNHEKMYPILKVNNLPFTITDFNGKLLSIDLMKTLLKTSGMILPNDFTLITGKKSALALVCFRYVGNCFGFMMIDEDHVFDNCKKNFESIADDLKSNSNVFTRDFVYSNSLIVSGSLKEDKTRPRFSQKGGCGKCGIF